VRRLHDSRGQASIELVAVLPMLALVCGALWQCVVAGQALWVCGSAARAAARAEALGGDPRQAAQAALPLSLARRASVEASANGTVVVRVRVPTVIGDATIGTVAAAAALSRQR
jgi:hypothetical protein